LLTVEGNFIRSVNFILLKTVVCSNHTTFFRWTKFASLTPSQQRHVKTAFVGPAPVQSPIDRVQSPIDRARRSVRRFNTQHIFTYLLADPRNASGYSRAVRRSLGRRSHQPRLVPRLASLRYSLTVLCPRDVLVQSTTRVSSRSRRDQPSASNYNYPTTRVTCASATNKHRLQTTTHCPADHVTCSSRRCCSSSSSSSRHSEEPSKRTSRCSLSSLVA